MPRLLQLACQAYAIDLFDGWHRELIPLARKVW
jgi:hypothetical protein